MSPDTTPRFITAPTFEDITGVPQNPMVRRLQPFLVGGEIAKMRKLVKTWSEAEAQSVKTGNVDDQRAAFTAFSALDEYVWKLAEKYPDAEPKESRDEIDLTPRSNAEAHNPQLGSMPIVFANSGSLGLRFLKSSARAGATGIAMQVAGGDTEEMESKLQRYAEELKDADPLCEETCMLTLDSTVEEYWLHIQKYPSDTALIVEGQSAQLNRKAKLVGILPRSVVEAHGKTSGTHIRQLPFIAIDDATVGKEGIDARTALTTMLEQNLEDLPIVNGDGEALGVIRKQLAGHSMRFPAHMNPQGGLAHLVAISPKTPIDTVQKWMEEGLLGVGIRLDRAHYDRGTKPYRYIEQVRQLIDRLNPDLDLIVGNIANPEAALRLARAGTKKVNVGVGPGRACTTRRVAGVGVPQIHVIAETREMLDKYGLSDTVFMIADGGLDEPGHLDKALKFADYGMIGTNAVKTRESGPRIENFNKKGEPKYVEHQGNASVAAQPPGSKVIAKPSDLQLYRMTAKTRAEGDSRNIAMHPEYENVVELTEFYAHGLDSHVSYMGADNLDELQRYGEYVQQTAAGVAEGKPRLT